jgi:hypothetical protein
MLMDGVVMVYLKKSTAMNKASAIQLLVTAEPVNFVVSRVLALPPQAFCPCVSPLFRRQQPWSWFIQAVRFFGYQPTFQPNN